MEELGITCHVGHPASIRQQETRRQKHDRRDAALLMNLLAENRFPSISMPGAELRDLRALLRHRHQWVCLRRRVRNELQGLALATAFGGAPDCGATRGVPRWPPCACCRTTANADPRCRRCTRNSRRRSKGWISVWQHKHGHLQARGSDAATSMRSRTMGSRLWSRPRSSRPRKAVSSDGILAT